MRPFVGPGKGKFDMMAGSVERIFLHAGPGTGDPMHAVGSARAIAAGGLEGDRFFQGAGSTATKRGPDREVTLIEAEVIEAVTREGKVTLAPEQSRRNIVTRGVALNHLVGREFRVGTATLRGIRLCEPCKHLETLTEPGMLMALLHRGGLRAEVVAGGEFCVGDRVEGFESVAGTPQTR